MKRYVGPVLIVLSVLALMTVVIRLDQNSDAEKRYFLCVVNRALSGQPQPQPDASCIPPTTVPPAQRTSAQSAAFLAELDCRNRRIYDRLPPVPSGENCLPPPSTTTTTGPPNRSTTTTTSTSVPSGSAAAASSEGEIIAAAAVDGESPRLVTISAALVPVLEVTLPTLPPTTLPEPLP